MGFFNRRPRNNNVVTDPAVTNGHHGHHDQHHDGHHDHHNTHHEKRQKRTSRPLFDMETGQFNRRPSFGQWLKMTWVDLLTMAAMGAIGLGVYEAHPAPSRSFPVLFQDGEIVYPEFAYPLRNEIIPIWAAALMGSLIPIFVILCMQIKIRSFWDVNNAVIGLLYSLITAAVFQVFIKWLIGGLRPHFLTVCDPDPAAVEGAGNGFRGIMFQRNICRGNIDDIDDSLESMPSGHSTAAFAGFMFLFFYLNAKLKVFSNHHPAMWKLVALWAPVLAACLIAGALTIDEYHNWYDCFAGAVIGTLMATSAYRMTYASIWDFRFNHIPLTRHTPFSYGAGAAGAGGFETAVFTRAGGWGYEEALGGAPFDAAHGLRGQVEGFNTTIHNKDHDVEHNAGLTSGRDSHHLNQNSDHINRDSHHMNQDSHHMDRDSRHLDRDPRHMGHDGHDSNFLNRDPNHMNRDSEYVNEPTTPIGGESRYHNHSRSVERKPLSNH